MCLDSWSVNLRWTPLLLTNTSGRSMEWSTESMKIQDGTSDLLGHSLTMREMRSGSCWRPAQIQGRRTRKAGSLANSIEAIYFCVHRRSDCARDDGYLRTSSLHTPSAPGPAGFVSASNGSCRTPAPACRARTPAASHQSRRPPHLTSPLSYSASHGFRPSWGGVQPLPLIGGPALADETSRRGPAWKVL